MSDDDGFGNGPWWEDLAGFCVMFGPFILLGLLIWWLES